MKTKSLLSLICLGLCGIFNKGLSQSTPPPVAAQWHFSGNNSDDPSFNIDNPSSIGGVDWVYSVLPTERKEYICAGYTSGKNSRVNPVIFKLDKYGNLVWIKHISQAASSSGNLEYNGSEFGYLTQVIKTPNGYAATGAVYIPNSGARAAILLEVDEGGGFLHNPTIFLSGQEDQSFGRTLAIDNDATTDHSIYIAGNCKALTTPAEYKAFVYKIDYGSWTMQSSAQMGDVYTAAGPEDGHGGNMFFKIRTRQTSATTHDLFACGYKSGSVDDNILHSNIVTLSPVNPSLKDTVTVTERDKDMWLVNLRSDLTTIYEKAYVKNDLNYPNSIVYNEIGPYSARGVENATSGLGAGTDATAWLKASVNKDERAYDFIFTADGNIAMVGLINQVAPLGYLDGNGPIAIQSAPILYNGIIHKQGSFIDPVRNYYFDEYMDGDGYLLKIDPSAGDVIYSKNVSHYSSKDFYPQIIQNGSGNFVISGSSADYSPSDYDQPEEYDALLLETPDAANTSGLPDHMWRRGFHAEGKEDGMCTFTLAQTADGGFVLGGDNDEDHDNFSITKFAPYCSSKPLSVSYVIDSRTYGGEDRIASGQNITWPNASVPDGSNIASKVIVSAGASLTIQNCHLHFASSDHMYDYWNLADDPNAIGRMMGIVVEPGGQLVISNSELSGIDDCQSSSATDRYMWDGIVIQGNPRGDRTSSQQGVLEIDNKSIIRDARIGVMVDDAHRHLSEYHQSPGTAIPDYETWTSSSRYNARGTYGGGIVHANDATWQDCRFSVNFQQYNISSSVTNLFENCSFLATRAGMGDPCFYADPEGKRQPSSTFFSAWDVQNLQIQNCNFICNDAFPVTQWPTGIIDADAGYDITRSHLTNLSTGIAGYFSPGITRPLNVEQNVFTNVGNGVNVSNNMNNMSITDNTFNVPGSEITGHPGGILLQDCTGYNISENTFTGMSKPALYATYPPSSRGIQVSFGSSWTTYNNLIHNNTFGNLRHPAIALQRNSDQYSLRGLNWKCNDFLSDNSRCIAMLSGVAGGTYVAATMAPAQGFYIAGFDNYPAENRFYTSCNNYNTTTSRERLYADFLVTQAVNYYYDPTAPEYNPNSGCISSIYTPTPAAGVVYANYCDPANMANDPQGHRPASTETQTMDAQQSEAHSQFMELQRDLYINASVREYAAKGENKNAGDLLEQNNRYAEALPFYISSQDWVAANTTWEKLPKVSTDEQQYAMLTRLTIDLYSNGKSWNDMTEKQKETIKNMAELDTYPGYMAAAIADRLQLRPFVWPYAVDASESSNKPASPVANSTKNDAGTIALFPNPTNGDLTLQSTEAGTLTLYNVQGILIRTFAIDAGKTMLNIPAAAPAGIYNAVFTNKAGSKQHQKITVTR